MFDHHVVFLDLETTGARAIDDRIIEVGLVEVAHGRCIGEWSTLVNPESYIPSAIQSLTGITEDMVARAPTFREISAELAQRLDGKILAAHNARFDYGFLKNEFRRAGIRYSARVLCTVKLSRRLFPQHSRHNLDAIMARYGIACDARHRALGDARVMWEMVQAWQREIDADRLGTAIADLLHYTTVPAGLPDTIFDDLPEAPGVYLFYGENDTVLYVGRSVNLRARVMSHFSNGHRREVDTRIAQEIRRIDWIDTAGELGALVTESRLLKELRPLYNRRLGPQADVFAWQWRAHDLPGKPELVSAVDLAVTRLDDLYGLFRSRAAALGALKEIASAHQLCPIVLGLEDGNGPCAAHALDRCRGACIGAETREQHALRLGTALSGLRMHRWPYAGPIAVRERGEHNARCELHVLNRWCYLGTARSETELHEIAASARSPVFDVDTYRMLARFLDRSRSADIIPLAV